MELYLMNEQSLVGPPTRECSYNLQSEMFAINGFVNKKSFDFQAKTRILNAMKSYFEREIKKNILDSIVFNTCEK